MRINRKTLVDYWGVLVIILGSGSYSFAHKSYVPAFIVMLLTSLAEFNLQMQQNSD